MFRYKLSQLKSIAGSLSTTIKPPYSVILQGNLGAGKTTFAKFFLQPILLKKNQTVVSPTFTIINTYETTKGVVWHADLYRLNDESELIELGLIEFAHGGITIIEWADIIEPYITDVPKTVIEL